LANREHGRGTVNVASRCVSDLGVRPGSRDPGDGAQDKSGRAAHAFPGTDPGSCDGCRGPRPACTYFASGTVVTATSLVIGPTRAPAFYDGIHAVAKRGQMNGGREESLEHKRLPPKDGPPPQAVKPTRAVATAAPLGAVSRRGFQKVSMVSTLRRDLLARIFKNNRYAGNSLKPSVGLEPTTPSLPWTGRGFTSVHRCPQTGTKSLQNAEYCVYARCARSTAGVDLADGKRTEALPRP
jgi:hypothetical protein